MTAVVAFIRGPFCTGLMVVSLANGYVAFFRDSVTSRDVLSLLLTGLFVALARTK